MALYNKENRKKLKEALKLDPTKRITCSFYKYVKIPDPADFRDQLYLEWTELEVYGRVYIAGEGINAQFSVPKVRWDDFNQYLAGSKALSNVPLKIAVEDDGKSFYKLSIKTREKIVADGLADDSFDVTKTGKHLNAKEFNDATEEKSTHVVDVRNYYESEVGHFENAIIPDADSFRDVVRILPELLAGKEDDKILLYCTGGIRCEKVSAYLKHVGYSDVNQLQGGIIDYAHQVKKQGLESKFIGKNFVFDERLGERITEDIISTCHQCGAPCDTHTNCANDACHLLFIQCKECAAKYDACCTNECKTILAMPPEDQIHLRKQVNKENSRNIHRSRLRPKLKEIIEAKNREQSSQNGR
ncbi:MAG: rhodanese-related sulfurtransferase [Bacteroidetes bacterium]|nr:rhodanese-related sulfurtransferase [Bacteroidota bacterium]